MSKGMTHNTKGRRQAVIFDFDGTIADSFAYVFEFLKGEAGDTTHYSSAELKQLRRMSMRQLALHLGIPVWRLLFTYFKGRRAMRAHMGRVQPFDGMMDTIRELHRDGCQLFIVSSNSSQNIRHLLRQQGVLGYFQSIRSGAGTMGKPTLIRQLLVRYRLSKQTTWYVGDETGDVLAARAVGLRCLAVGWGFANPDDLKRLEPHAFIDTPADIVSTIEAAWKK